MLPGENINAKTIALIVLSMVCITLKLLCNLLYFRHINFNIFNVNIICLGAAFFYSLIYIINDAIAFIGNRKIATIIIIVGTLCDGLYSYIPHFMEQLSTPIGMSSVEISNNNAINQVGPHIFMLFVHGSIASIVAAVFELMIFTYFIERINSFTISTMISITVVLLFHNLITDNMMLYNAPDKWSIIFVNLGLNISIMFFYSIVVSMILSINRRHKFIIFARSN